MCGLKLSVVGMIVLGVSVTPHVGVWIETQIVSTSEMAYRVTPHVGVWIETGL